jgi:hypothetical protein
VQIGRYFAPHGTHPTLSPLVRHEPFFTYAEYDRGRSTPGEAFACGDGAFDSTGRRAGTAHCGKFVARLARGLHQPGCKVSHWPGRFRQQEADILEQYSECYFRYAIRAYAAVQNFKPDLEGRSASYESFLLTGQTQWQPHR